MTTIELILWIGSAIVLSALWYGYATYYDAQKRSATWAVTDLLERRRLLAVPAASALVLGVFVGLWAGEEITGTFMARILVFTSALFAIAALDYKYHLVPNRALIYLLIMRAVIVPFEIAAGVEPFLDDLKRELITAVILAGFFLLMRVLQRGGLGMGDVKLLALMPLFYGPTTAIAAIVASFLTIFVVSAALLATKRKKMGDGLPLAPSVLVGSLAVILLLSLGG